MNNQEWQELVGFAKGVLNRTGEGKLNYIDPEELVTAAYLASGANPVLSEIRKSMYAEIKFIQKGKCVRKQIFVDSSFNDSRKCSMCKGYFPDMEFKPREKPEGTFFNAYCRLCTRIYRSKWSKTPAGRACIKRLRDKYISNLHDCYVISLLVASTKGQRSRTYFKKRLPLIIDRRQKIFYKRLGISFLADLADEYNIPYWKLCRLRRIKGIPKIPGFREVAISRSYVKRLLQTKTVK